MPVGLRAENFNIVSNNHGHITGKKCDFSVFGGKYPLNSKSSV